MKQRTPGDESDSSQIRAARENASLASEAYGVVRRRIVRGELALGQVISRRKLAAELGMSFLPVSEALLRLEFEGLLESRPRAGTRVRIPSPEDVRGHYIVREALEVQAAMLFAREATPQERAELQRLAGRLDSLCSSVGPVSQMNVVHTRLHRHIAESARCPALVSAIEQTYALASTWFCSSRESPITQATTRHRDLAQALCNGTPEEAAAATRDHLAGSMQKLLERLKPFFRLRKAHGRTFHRSERKQKRHVLRAATPLNAAPAGE